jgi:coiled-coil-helix-coiled-coil-helix domain-containing protein 2
MAATAGSVAVGSTIGHGLSSMLFGGGSSHAAPAAEAAPVPVQQHQQSGGLSCEVQAKGKLLARSTRQHSALLTHLRLSDFTKCLEKADLPSCTWYLEQLKAVRPLRDSSSCSAPNRCFVVPSCRRPLLDVSAGSH